MLSKYLNTIILMATVSLAQSGSGPRPQAAGSTDNQWTPQSTAAASGSAPPADGRRPVDNPADDRALVPYQAEAGIAR